MCRVYKRKDGKCYVRLCSYHGAQKGMHIPVEAGFRLEGKHYPKNQNKKRNNSLLPAQRCLVCGGPVSRHKEICQL